MRRPRTQRAFGRSIEVVSDSPRRLRTVLIMGGCYAVGIAIFCGLLTMYVEKTMHGSGAVRVAMMTAASSPCVQQNIGTPLTTGPFILGDLDGNTGSAHITIPVQGPKGEGKLMVDAKKTAGRWNVNAMNLEHNQYQYRLVPSPDRNGCVLAP